MWDLLGQITVLAGLGFAPQLHVEGEVIRCVVPSHRLDIDREIDLIEEVARVYGYGHSTPHDRVSHPVQPEPCQDKASRVFRQSLTSAVFFSTSTVTDIRRAEPRRRGP